MDEAEILRQELEHYRSEKERIRKVIGQIGGATSKRQDRLINIIFLTVIAALFVIEIATKWLPVLVSLEIGVLLISVKIVWMIHSHSKFYHFQFWVLNTIEFQMNDLVKRVRRMEKMMEGEDGSS